MLPVLVEYKFDSAIKRTLKYFLGRVGVERRRTCIWNMHTHKTAEHFEHNNIARSALFHCHGWCETATSVVFLVWAYAPHAFNPPICHTRF
jgi:hypothetical protein